MLSMLFGAPQIVNATNTINAKQNIDPVTGYDITPIVKYKSASDDTYELWHENVKNVIEPYVIAELTKVFETNERIRTDEGYGIRTGIGIATVRSVTIWNNIITKYPESKNARVAFCKYGKEIGYVSKSVLKCDKDFQFNPQDKNSLVPLGTAHKAIIAPPLK
ncbi:hypothetical protein [Paralysiella testudinis]|uniref:Uncharacterized protein n=2 Tax=Paralysiella testudinis TaxID=2809020 RepID=A0A892ZD31_9NEIS|nr:hypothetical protein [Paralysiella testudinis]QRQ80951.1 hypothetical protein JQU52_09410 [Paralysiella testudinis]